MMSRLAFVAIAAFWVTMNVLLWRTEYGAEAGAMPIPVALVWHRILTAPDASSLTIFQSGQRTGFCEFSTSVEQAMAGLDEDKLPPEGLVARAGYQIRINGNMGLGDFTNRVRFDGHLQFSASRQWREINLKAATRDVTVFIHSAATNGTVSLEFKADGAVIKRVLHFSDLQDPAKLIRSLAGNPGGDIFGDFDWPVFSPPAAPAAELQWEAHRDRVLIGREPVPAYRLETKSLAYKIVIYVSTLGEILRVELPGGIVASIDELEKPVAP